MIRHFSLFSGIESFKKALDNLKIDNELVGYSEFDKYASVALSAIHGVSEELNYGDITKIDETKVPDCDLITYGFPCQDISVAGLGKGIIEGETRSGLLFDALRIIKHKKPKYAIAENVKNLVGKRFKEDFEGLLAELDSYGYNNYWKVLNSKDYGIPQNRERVFVVSIRKDIDKGYEFPKPFDNGLRLKDFLEDEVEDKYYIDNDRTSILLNNLKEQAEPILIGGMQKNQSIKTDGISTTLVSAMGTGGGYVPMIVASRGRNPNNPSDRTVGSPTEQRFFKDDVCGTIRTVDSGGDKRVIEKTNELLVVGNTVPSEHTAGRVFDVEGISPTVMYRNAKVVQILEEEEETPNELQLFTNLSGGKWDKIHESARRVYDQEGIAPTIPTCGGGNIEPKVQTDYKIRKLTPKECWRLMGFTDEDYHKARQALEDRFYNGGDRSNSQMYKMAGNSIVVNVIEGILRNLLFEKEMLEMLEEEE